MDITALRTEFADLHTKATALVEKVSTDKRDFTAEEKTANDGHVSRMKQIKATLDANKELAGLEFSAPESQNVERPTNPANKDDANITVGDTFAPKPKVNRQEFAKAMAQWAETGQMDPKMAAKFATITTATQNGIFLPTEVDQPIIPSATNTIREAMAALGVEPMKTTTTRKINIPIANTTAGGKVAETATTETEQEASFSESVTLTPSTYQSGSSWFSNLDLAALDFDLMAAVLPGLAYSKELALESDIVSTMAADANVVQTVPTATVGGFIYDNLVSLNHKLPKRFNGLKAILLSKDAYAAAENLKSTTGFPILNQDAQNQSLKKFNGTPVIWTDYLSTFAANNVVGMVISMIGFRLRDAGQERVARYANYPLRADQTGFNLFGSHAFGYSINAVAKLVCPAS
jgi:HK97 family phage major capsid protein